MTNPNDPNQPPGGYGPPPPPGGGYGPPMPPGGGYGGPPPQQINNFLVPSILTTVFCCLPFGIVAIINAAKVNGLLAQGDYAGAQAAANNAKKWSIVAAVLGVIVIIVDIILFATGVIGGTTTTTSYGN
jgi:uncharacterized membrane protein